MKLRNLIGKTQMRLFTTSRELSYVRHRSGTIRRIKDFGKNFAKTFKTQDIIGKNHFQVEIRRKGHESSLTISINKLSKVKNDNGIGHLCLGFGKNTVFIESIQGKYNRKSKLNDFRRAVKGKPWQNYLLEEVEKHSRELGFTKIKIRAPETLYYYHHPAYILNPKYLVETKIKTLKQEGKSEKAVAREVEKYRAQLKNPRFLKKQLQQTLREHQQRLITMYDIIAKANGYKRKGITYVKKL